MFILWTFSNIGDFYHKHAVQEFRQYTPLNNMLFCKLRLAKRNVFFSSLIAGCRYSDTSGCFGVSPMLVCTMPKVRPIVRGKVVNHIKTFFNMFCLNSSLHGIVVEPGLDPFIFAIIFLWEIKDFSMQLKGIFIIYKVSYEIEVSLCLVLL